MKAGEWDKLIKARDFVVDGFQPHTIWNYDSAIRYLEDYNRRRKVPSWKEWDCDRAIDYVGWLSGHKLTDVTVRKIAEITLGLIESLQILNPDAVSPDFVIPRAHLPVLSPTYRDGDDLRPDGLKRILAAALKEAPTITAVTTLRNLVPFALLLAIRTGMNAESLYGLERDCLVPIASDYYLIWNKARAGGELRQRHSVEAWGVVAVVQRLQCLTKGSYLFSLPGVRKERRIYNFEPALSEFCNDHGLPAFTLGELRPAIASWIYELNDGDILKVKQFLGHRDVATTLRYLHEWVIRPQQERAIAEGQTAMFERWGISREDQRG